MSDFATPDSKYNHSYNHIMYLKKFGINCVPELIFKREKGAYLYDIDENKYCDFNLHDGSVLLGHNYHKLTQYIKNGISVGSSSGYYNKFYYRLLRLLGEFCDFNFAYFFNGTEEALIRLVLSYNVEYVAVNTQWLKIYIQSLLPDMPVKIANKHNTYPLLFLEPLDFDGNLCRVRPDEWNAKIKVGVDIRTAFRVEKGFSFQLGPMLNALLVGGSISNGLNIGLILSQKNMQLYQTGLSAFQTLAILETLKYYRRHLFNHSFPSLQNADVIRYGSVFKINKETDPVLLQQHAIFMRGQVGFLSLSHTSHDIHRLSGVLKLF